MVDFNLGKKFVWVSDCKWYLLITDYFWVLWLSNRFKSMRLWALKVQSVSFQCEVLRSDTVLWHWWWINTAWNVTYVYHIYICKILYLMLKLSFYIFISFIIGVTLCFSPEKKLFLHLWCCFGNKPCLGLFLLLQHTAWWNGGSIGFSCKYETWRCRTFYSMLCIYK